MSHHTRFNGNVVGELQLVESDALAGKHVIHAAWQSVRLSLAQNQRADAVRVSKADYSETWREKQNREFMQVHSPKSKQILPASMAMHAYWALAETRITPCFHFAQHQNDRRRPSLR